MTHEQLALKVGVRSLPHVCEKLERNARRQAWEASAKGSIQPKCYRQVCSLIWRRFEGSRGVWHVLLLLLLPQVFPVGHGVSAPHDGEAFCRSAGRCCRSWQCHCCAWDYRAGRIIPRAMFWNICWRYFDGS